jgi:hypothetical protein
LDSATPAKNSDQLSRFNEEILHGPEELPQVALDFIKAITVIMDNARPLIKLHRAFKNIRLIQLRTFRDSVSPTLSTRVHSMEHMAIA